MNRQQQSVAWILVVVMGATAFFSLTLRLSASASPVQSQTTQAAINNIYLPLVIDQPGNPIILYFEANVPIADPGDTITLSWDTLNVVTATILRMSPGGPIVQFWDVAPSGTLTYTIGLHERNVVSFALNVANEAGIWEGQFLNVPLTCPDTWFFAPAPEGCPGGPALLSPGAEQPFEYGTMLWVGEQSGEQSYIYVLFDDDVFSPRWAIYPDTWEEGEELCDPGPPPPGYQQPERGFGKVWCEEAEVRERLGWALSSEVGYETAVQADSAPKYTTTYIRAADGNVWKLLPERSGWEKIYVE
jgi:hypothetical protein